MNINCLNHVSNQNVGLTSIANTIRLAVALENSDMDTFDVTSNSNFIILNLPHRNKLLIEEFKPTWLNRLLFKPGKTIFDSGVHFGLKCISPKSILCHYKVTETGPNYVILDTGGGSRVKVTQFECA